MINQSHPESLASAEVEVSTGWTAVQHNSNFVRHGTNYGALGCALTPPWIVVCICVHMMEPRHKRTTTTSVVPLASGDRDREALVKLAIEVTFSGDDSYASLAATALSGCLQVDVFDGDRSEVPKIYKLMQVGVRQNCLARQYTINNMYNNMYAVVIHSHV